MTILRKSLPVYLCILLFWQINETQSQEQVSEKDKGHAIHSNGNPILADGSYYSTDPAPIVVGNTLYILAGRDEAPLDVNDFIMNEWQIFATNDVASGNWVHYPNIARPETLFSWAASGRAYAGQIVQAPNHRYYMYSPVMQAHTDAHDPSAIGVAVADSPLGPWKDAHPSGPIVSQSLPEPNRMQNIDPTVWVDNDGRAYLYWGTFGQLRGVELKPDMVTPTGLVVAIRNLHGYFEAPWLFKRGRTYYMVYAGNQAGPHSECTPAVYHACIAYGTSDSPLGPWTYRGVILDPVSSTTSHEGVIEFKGQWYLVYHTADAKGGGHFRRSVAIDKMEWDDSTMPPSIRKVKPTRAPIPERGPRRNIAPAAVATASNEPVPVQYWIKSLNDEIVRPNPLPPDMWATWIGDNNPPHPWIQYLWKEPVQINGTRILFWNDQPAGSNSGVAPPVSWQMNYWNGKEWVPVPHPSGYNVGPGFQETSFDPVLTSCVRVLFDASGQGDKHAAVAVQEWEVLAPHPVLLPISPGSPPRSSTGNSEEEAGAPPATCGE